MEAWNIEKYEAPYLAVTSIGVDLDAREVILQDRDDEYAVEVGDYGPLENVAMRLGALRDPRSPAWRDLRGANRDPGWSDLLQSIDQLGLVRDAGTPVQANREAELDRLRDAIERCVRSVSEEVPSASRAALSENVRVLLADFDALAAQAGRRYGFSVQTHSSLRSDFELLALGNFYQQIALVQARYMRGQAPLSLVCCALALRLLLARLGGSELPSDDLDRLLAEFAAGAYSSTDAERHLNGLAEYLVSGVGPKAARYCKHDYAATSEQSGIDFMLDVERVAREVSGRLETPRYLQALEQPNASVILVHGRYLQDYHVTCRFPEIITSILPKRLTPELRKKAFRYYTEEVNHDVLEYQSCRELGLSDAQIQAAQPLPLHYAYVDVFTYLGEIDPVAYAVSIFITEGTLGADSPLDEPYKRLIGDFMSLDKHILLNEKYHHTSIPRLFMTEVKAVAPATQRLAMTYMLLLLELNYRAWDDLLEHYAQADQRFMRVLPPAALPTLQ